MSVRTIPLIAAMVAGVAFGQAGLKPRTITTTECRELVYALLQADGWTKLPGFAITFDDVPDYPEFCHPIARHDGPEAGTTTGHFAVERATGEVWSVDICGRYTSPALSKLQRTLRHRIGLTDTEYAKLRKPGPTCQLGQAPRVSQMGSLTIEDLYIDSGGNANVVRGDGTEFQPSKSKRRWPL